MKRSLFLAMIALGMLSCSHNPIDPATGHNRIKQVAPYLYEVSYDRINDALYADQEAMQQLTTAPQCSSVRRGNYHGRNLDLYYNEGCEVVVHRSKDADHLANIAVCGGTPTLNKQLIDAGLSEDIYALIPFFVLDGINECGVVVNVNVVPAIDMVTPTGTNPEAENLSMQLACRYLLDRAESAHHAIELLKARNLYGEGFGGEFQFHLMISDKDSTMIVELINNQLHYQAEPALSDKNIMTNYFCTLDTLTPHADGIERRDLLRAHYDEAVSAETMMQLMERVKYTNLYRYETRPRWYSDLTGITKIDGVTYNITINTPQEVADFIFKREAQKFQDKYPGVRDGSFWQTVHTSVYSIEERQLLISNQEDYQHQYHFAL